MTVLIPPTTNPAVSAAIAIGNDRVWRQPAAPLTVMLIGTPAGTDKITLQYNNGLTWVDMKIAGSVVALDSDTNIRTLYGPLELRLSKTVTAAAIGAVLCDGRGV
jgi:hypothetical protein